MISLSVSRSGPLSGEIRVPGDKSISHRALFLGAIADGKSEITGFLPCNDCLATLTCIRTLGIEVGRHDETSLVVHGKGRHGLLPPDAPLNCTRSGTTMRLLTGTLAGQPFDSVLTGDPQLLRRPMGRVVDPLVHMGARIETEDGHAPLTVHGRDLHGITYEMPVASAQVKSAILLAGLYANSSTTVHQTGPARDHTERMLSAMGAKIATDGCSLTVSHSELSPLSISIPGDFSSAAFPIVAATIVRGSNITLREVGINPTRTGLLAVLSAMGASVAVEGFRNAGNEPVADLRVQSANLHAVEIDGDTVVRMIDEFPILAVAATQAEGTTIVRDAAELRVKETDRIATVAEELRKLGARIEPTPDGYVVQGLTPLHGAAVSSHGDHRLAMALAVAGLVADGTTQIDDIGCANDSFPGFAGLMRAIGGQYD